MRKVAKFAAIFSAVGAALFVGVLLWLDHDRPDYADYVHLELAAAPNAPLQVTFFGVSTLLISDGTTHLLTDGFFSRPPITDLVRGHVEPNPQRISETLQRAGIRELAAVMPVHAHYDHAMDAPEVARLTGALLLGCESTANIGRGWGLPEERIRIVTPGTPYRFGRFTLTFIASDHIDVGSNSATLDGKLTKPLRPPAPPMSWPEGVTWSIHVAHPEGKLLVQGSAGFIEGALDNYHADTVLLGMGLLSKADEEYRLKYLRQVVDSVGARRIIPIHFDDFMRPLDTPMKLFPRVLDNLDRSMKSIEAWRAEAPTQRSVALLPWLRPVNPFAVERK